MVPDRLPTVQASQVLDELQNESRLFIPTGVENLDAMLASRAVTQSENHVLHGGVKRGQVTELWGPPGTGKTAISTQLAANAMRAASDVVWIDCFYELQLSRLEKTIQNLRKVARSDPERGTGDTDCPEGKFVHFSCLTLPHFMALISRPNTKAIPQGIALLIISNVSALINSSLPKIMDDNTNVKANKGQAASAKRRQALQFIVNALQKLAATKDCAVVVLSQCASKMQSEQGATLTAAVNASAWDQGISTRLFMFRDWARRDGKLVNNYLAGLQKLDGQSTDEMLDRVAAFAVHSTGVTSAEYDLQKSSVQAGAPIDASSCKRKLETTDFEVPDSEDEEDYGWAGVDEETLPAPPPQWQGSEDILLGHGLGQTDDERDEYESDDTHTSVSDATH